MEPMTAGLIAGGLGLTSLVGGMYGANQQADAMRASAAAQERGQLRAIEEQRRAALCNCKHTKEKPFCDGTHTTL